MKYTSIDDLLPPQSHCQTRACRNAAGQCRNCGASTGIPVYRNVCALYLLQLQRFSRSRNLPEYGILLSVRTLPSGRFRAWPWNGEFFRRGCLAVGCRCFAASCVEQRRRSLMERNIKMDLKRCLNRPTLSQPGAKMGPMATKIK